MNENVIEFIRGAETATLTFSQGRYISKIRKLAKSRPDECQIVAENKDGSIMAHVPVSWVKISPKREVNMTEERRKQLAEILRAGRNK